MNQRSIKANRFFDGETLHQDVVVTVNDGYITSIVQSASDVAFDEQVTGTIVPGFIDLQVNGGGGVLFNASPSLNGIRAIMAAHAQYGTTAMLPTLITDKIEVMEQAADAIAQAIAVKEPGILGVHFEGPHLAVAKKGAHSEQFIRPISEQEWAILSRKDLGLVYVTLAPENVLLSDIEKMIELGIKVSLGHSNANYATAQAAIDAGADSFTHLFNAMSPLQGREPGMVGAALINDSAICGLILDGLHVDYASCRVALQAKPKGKLVLVTDAMPPVGSDQKEFDFFDRKVFREGDKLTATTGELAGSALDMATAVANAQNKLGLSLQESVNMASLYPAQYIENSELGHLTVGAKADMVHLSDNGSVIDTWIAGSKVFSK